MPLKLLESITSALSEAMKRKQSKEKPARADEAEDEESKGERIKKGFNKALNMEDEEK